MTNQVSPSGNTVQIGMAISLQENMPEISEDIYPTLGDLAFNILVENSRCFSVLITATNIEIRTRIRLANNTCL